MVHGVSRGAERLNEDETLISEIFHRGGYKTAAFQIKNQTHRFRFMPAAVWEACGSGAERINGGVMRAVSVRRGAQISVWAWLARAAIAQACWGRRRVRDSQEARDEKRRHTY